MAASGYFGTLKSLFTNPTAFFDSPPASWLQALLFPVINLAIMLLVQFFVVLLSVLTMPRPEGSKGSNFDTLTGDFWGQLFKGLGLSALYAVIFIAAIAGIIYIFTLIARKDTSYRDILSMGSIFSLNFLAVAVTSLIGLLNVWITSADFVSIVNQITGLVTSLVFVYATVLIIQGIASVTSFNMIKSTAIFVVSMALIVFITGKIVQDLPKNGDFSIDFGGYSNSISKTTQIVNSLKSSLDSLYKLYSQ